MRENAGEGVARRGVTASGGCLGRVLDGYDDALAQSVEGGLKLFGPGFVIGVEHAAHDCFPDSKPPGKSRVADTLLAHGEIQRELSGDPQRNGDQPLPSLESRRRRDGGAIGDPGGDHAVGAAGLAQFLSKYSTCAEGSPDIGVDPIPWLWDQTRS